jgi:hypothetical protein
MEGAAMDMETARAILRDPASWPKDDSSNAVTPGTIEVF